MMIELTEEEREAILRLIEREINDLGPEIRHTYHAGNRDELRAQKKALRSLHERLAHSQPA